MKSTSDNSNKAHWERVGRSYQQNWENPAKQLLSNKETDWLRGQLQRVHNKNARVLDIGIGSGRIIKNHLDELKKRGGTESQIHGIDISQPMVDHCRGILPKANLKQCNIAKESLPFNGKFDFISAIRILKYNENWRDILKQLIAHLSDRGVIAFTMINNNSADRFAIYPLSVHKTSRRELQQLLYDMDLEILDTRGFSRIPDFLYNTLGTFSVGARLIHAAEYILESLMGPVCMTRILFVACRRR